MSVNVGDHVILINGTPAVPSGSAGVVTLVAGNNVEVDFGVLLGRLMTTAQNLSPAASGTASMSATPTASPVAVASGGAPQRKIHWALPAIGKVGSADAASFSATPAPSNAMSVLFNSATVDLQGAGELAAVWATTLTFGMSGDLQKKAPVTLHLRGFIHTDKKASAVLMVYLDGKLHRKEFKRGKARSGIETWSLRQTLPANATTHVVSLVVLAERAATTDNVTATIDAIDIALVLP